MKKRLPLLVALGTAYSFYKMFQLQQREVRIHQWDRTHPRRALITGASSGIGAEFAHQLARDGYDLVVLARREDRLRALAADLHRAYGTQVDVIVADLNNPQDLERAAQQAAEVKDLDLLVNNAGFGVGGRFSDVDTVRNMEMVRVNVEAAVRIARAVLPGMVERGRGGIINVSSVASFLPAKGNHTYGATKAYLNFFTESLHQELEGTGVRVQALCPGYTFSEFHDVMQVDRKTIPDFLWLKAEDVVHDSLEGLREGRLWVVPGKIYWLIANLSSIPGMATLIRLGERLLRFRRLSAQ